MNIKNLQEFKNEKLETEILEVKPMDSIELYCRSCNKYTSHEYAGDYAMTNATPQGEIEIEYAYVCECDEGMEWVDFNEVM